MTWRFFEACHSAEIPTGARKRVVVEGYPICLVNADGTVVATSDPCPHEGASLGEGGHVEGEWLVCGVHRWAFHLRSGACREDPQVALPRFPVGRRGDLVYVGFWVEGGDDDGDV